MRQPERLVFFLLLCSPCLFHVSHGRRPTSTPQKAKDSAPAPPIRAVNLGGWLVTEGWILPSLFDGIPNKDFLDGTQLQFKSVTQNMFLSAEQGGGTIIVFNNQFVTVAGDGVTVVATVTSPGPGEAFQIVRNADKTRVRIRAPSGKFLQAKTSDSVTADYDGESTNWGNDDPSVFVLTVVTGLQGEYQICNGYGKAKATQVLRKHWSTYIVENDFKFISASGLNAVRIPVGWWIASGSNPPPPFIGGSLQALDNAFNWHTPGSQNPFEHSASKDGSQDWGKTDANIAQTVQVIDFLASRYANCPSLLAVELLNEPLAPGVSLPALTKYYNDGYSAVRKHTASAYVIMSNRLSASNTELLEFASGLPGSVIDVHYYNLFSSAFDGLTADQNIDFVRTNRSSELSTVTRQNGPLTFVGEWVAEWNVGGATKEDYQRFAQVQIDVYGRATFGWSYWTLKNVRDHWSMQWMISNGYISLNTTS
ncbi:hypothetical protein GUJ93_ZPchr0012g19705 [Zizania palustris]|uniref:Mannan endo-1,4-beta-mannosidase n=1 Tax=Zizania palustris TaxID=103762 RepID=A0A8J5WGW0_ZIZPA|nr:hypothetical protein GUJ93_ZPchr0012g19705 [Zizania palustris]